MGYKPQKNWSPFFCDNKICFVYSIVPHKIISFSNDTLIREKKANMTFIAETNTDIHSIWKFGQPRGGSQAELIDTPYGKRFLTFFHSSLLRGHQIKTYFSGAYLFQSIYPYEITHISSEPLSPRSFYNISQSWPHRGMDFVVFPMSFIKDNNNDTIYVSFGVQDNSGYILALNSTSFLLSLKSLSK